MDKTILITGAGSGIGRVTARTFLDAGWRVGLIGRREDALRETAGDSAALVLPCDVCDADAVDAAFDRAVADGWDVDGAPGFVYTTDWSGRPVVSQRMHWVAAEAISAAAALAVPTTFGPNMTEVWYWVITKLAPTAPMPTQTV